MTTFQDVASGTFREPAADGAELAFWRERATQLQRALDTRIVIEQAKGMLAERFSCDVETAFSILRHAARSSHTNLRALAGEVVAAPVTPPAVAHSFRTARAGRRGA
jgi:hypothetical protein